MFSSRSLENMQTHFKIRYANSLTHNLWLQAKQNKQHKYIFIAFDEDKTNSTLKED